MNIVGHEKAVTVDWASLLQPVRPADVGSCHHVTSAYQKKNEVRFIFCRVSDNLGDPGRGGASPRRSQGTKGPRNGMTGRLP